MTDSLDAAIAPLHAYLRGISDPEQRYAAVRETEKRLESLVRTHLQETALGLRAEGKKWREVGAIMGGVTYQRAFQIGHGE